MRRIIMLLILMVSIQVVRPMSMTRCDETTVQLYGISRVLPYELSQLRIFLEDTFCCNHSSPLLIISGDGSDAEKLIEKIATTAENTFFKSIDIEYDLYKQKRIDFEKKFEFAKQKVLFDEGKILLYFHHADELVDMQKIEKYETHEQSKEFARVIEKMAEYEDIVVVVHTTNGVIPAPWFKYQFSNEVVLVGPTLEQIKTIMFTVFRQHNAIVSGRLVNHLAKFLENASWSRVHTISDAIAREAKKNNSSISADVIRKRIPEFMTPMERMTQIASSILSGGSSFFDGMHPILFGFLTYIVLSKVAKNEKNAKKQPQQTITQSENFRV